MFTAPPCSSYTYRSPPASTGLVPDVLFCHAVARCGRRPTRSTYPAVPESLATDTYVRPRCDHTTGAVNTVPPPGAATFSISPPSRLPAPPVVPFSRSRFSRCSCASFPPWTASRRPPAGGRIVGAVLPRSPSLSFSCAWLVGVQLWSRRPASGLSSSTLSPQSVEPLNGALPVATSSRPLPGSTTAPARAQIAESLAGHELGGLIS